LFADRDAVVCRTAIDIADVQPLRWIVAVANRFDAPAEGLRAVDADEDTVDIGPILTVPVVGWWLGHGFLTLLLRFFVEKGSSAPGSPC
jgi:hypothetical protein